MGTLTGCWTGYQAQTTMQRQGGEVASADGEDVAVRGMVWVRDPKEPDTAYFSGTVVAAEASQPDELLSISAEPGGDAGLTSTPIEVAPRLPVRIGFNGEFFASVSGVPDSPSPFLLTTLEFRDAGSVTTSVLVVPGTGPHAQVVTDSRRGLAAEERASTATPTAEPQAPLVDAAPQEAVAPAP
jgi:hypothetical protein